MEGSSDKASWGDIALMSVITGGIFLVFLMGCCIYAYTRAFVRRFIKRMPNWEDF